MSNNKYFNQEDIAVSDVTLAYLTGIPPIVIPFVATMNQHVNTTATPQFSKIGINQSAGADQLGVSGSSLFKRTTAPTMDIAGLITTVADSSFSSDTGHWTTGGATGWSIAGSKYVHTATAVNGGLSTPTFLVGTYRVDFTLVTTTIGTIRTYIGGDVGLTTYGTVIHSGTVVSDIIECTVGGTNLSFLPNATWAGNIDGVQVYKLNTGTNCVLVSDALAAAKTHICQMDDTSVSIGQGIGTLKGESAVSSYSTYFGCSTGKYAGGSNNSAFGALALGRNLSVSNSAFGMSALWQNTTGNGNSAFGIYCMNGNLIGTNNSAFGYRSLSTNVSGTYNSTLGYYSGKNIITGSHNVCLGENAGVPVGSAPTLGSTTNTVSIGTEAISADYGVSFMAMICILTIKKSFLMVNLHNGKR